MLSYHLIFSNTLHATQGWHHGLLLFLCAVIHVSLAANVLKVFYQRQQWHLQVNVQHCSSGIIPYYVHPPQLCVKIERVRVKTINIMFYKVCRRLCCVSFFVVFLWFPCDWNILGIWYYNTRSTQKSPVRQQNAWFDTKSSVQHKNTRFDTKMPYPACISWRCHNQTSPSCEKRFSPISS